MLSRYEIFIKYFIRCAKSHNVCEIVLVTKWTTKSDWNKNNTLQWRVTFKRWQAIVLILNSRCKLNRNNTYSRYTFRLFKFFCIFSSLISERICISYGLWINYGNLLLVIQKKQFKSNRNQSVSKTKLS